jgi:riboflavin kinase/FMN adenylyltransferase
VLALSKVLIIRSSREKIATPCAIALGNFDGIHLGHQQVLQPILKGGAGVYSTVVTFNPHPREFFSGEKKQLLTPLEEKVEILEGMGLKQLVSLPFDTGLAQLTPEQFVENILVKRLEAKTISVGEDFRFGCQRSGNAGYLKTLGETYSIDVTITRLKKEQGMTRISSSLIRQALGEGNLSHARAMLGRPYVLIGKVVPGRQLGRKIGFPTANLQLPADKLLPRLGVYMVWVEYGGEKIKGVMNIGYRPTVEGEGISVEVHLLDWCGDLYDRTLRVSLEGFLRPEKKFASIDDLIAQIGNDCYRARELFQKSV